MSLTGQYGQNISLSPATICREHKGDHKGKGKKDKEEFGHR